MKLLVLLLIFLYASSTWSQDFDFICGFSQMSESDINQAVDTTPINHRRGQIKHLSCLASLMVLRILLTCGYLGTEKAN